MAIPPSFASKTPEQIKSEMHGFAPSCIEAAIRFHQDGRTDTFLGMLPGMLAFHLPPGKAAPPAVLEDGLRLNQDLGLDSLSLTEMAFKMDDLFGITIETREMAGVETIGDLKAFLGKKLDPP